MSTIKSGTMNLKKKLRIYSLGIISALCFIPIQEMQSATIDFLRISGEKVVDQQGRTIILNGLNHVNKNTKDKYLNADDEKLFKQFKSWGFNCIRYGIIWDGLEPQPGVINMEYLNEIDKRVKWAEDNGIYLILVMHQDLYGQ
ncbi:MAG: cellulase family glycosylhydrolase, partial [Bacteroidales bacterium]